MSRRSAGRQRGLTLIELLVAMIVMGILSTMIIMTWVTLTNAYSYTSRSDKQRDSAAQAIARMAREIRDAQAVPGSGTGAFVLADPGQIQFYSTFNMEGNEDPTATPRLTRFIFRETDSVQRTGVVYREVSTGGAWGSSMPLVKDVMNPRVGKDIFIYSAIDPVTGVMYQSDGTTVPVPPSRIQTVTILLLVDLNPGHSPVFMDIKTTVEPRNVRHL